jgi:hypothetical protein
MDAALVPLLVFGVFLVGPLVIVPLGLRLVPGPASARAARLLRIASHSAVPRHGQSRRGGAMQRAHPRLPIRHWWWP